MKIIDLRATTVTVPLEAPLRHANGCRAHNDCHRPVVEYPISVRTLVPDIAAPWSLATYRSGRDPAMEAVAAALMRAVIG